MDLDELVARLRALPPAERFAADLPVSEIDMEEDPRVAAIAELYLEAPRHDREFSALHSVEHRLPDGKRLKADASPETWRAAAVRARVSERIGYRFGAFDAARNAEACGAPREPWARWLDDPVYPIWKDDRPLLAPWALVEGQLRIQRSRPAHGAPQDHLIAALAQIGTDEVAYWSVIPDGGPELCLREEDMLALERASGRSRFELGGRTIRSTAPTPTAAVAELLLAVRVPAIEAFVPRLVAAIAGALDAGTVEPLRALMQAEPSLAPAAWWFAQAIVGRDGDELVWNTSAMDVLDEMLGDAIELDPSARRELVGPLGLLLGAFRGEHKLGVMFHGGGAVSVTTGDAWEVIDLPRSPAEILAEAVQLLDDDDEAALAALDQAAGLAGVDPIVHFHRGVALYRLGDTPAALAAFERAAAGLAGAHRRHALVDAAAMHRELGDGDRALAILRDVAGEFPGDPEAWYALGLDLVKRGSYDDSIAAETKALALDPDHASAHYAVACAYALRSGGGDVDRALEHIGHAVDNDLDLAEQIADDEDFAALRDDVRFRRLVLQG